MRYGLACPRSVCDDLTGRQWPIQGDQVIFTCTATATTNNGLFTVMMRIWRKADELGSAGGRLPSKGACARGERAGHAGSQAQLIWCSPIAAPDLEHPRVSHVTQKLVEPSMGR